MQTEANSLIKLETIPVTQLKGVGAKTAQVLAKKQIYTVQDLLFHLPFRYQDRTKLLAIRDLQVGDHAVIEGVIQSQSIKPGRKTQLVCQLSDGTGQLSLRFFNFNSAQAQHLQRGTKVRCFGEVRSAGIGLTMFHPECTSLDSKLEQICEEKLTPIYPITEGLSQFTIRSLIEQALEYLNNDGCLSEYLPKQILEKFQLTSLKQAILFLHHPPPDCEQNLLLEGTHPMQQRLAFEELMAQQLSLLRLRDLVKQHKAPALDQPGELITKFKQQLAFELTGAQQRVTEEIIADLIKPHPMLRLVQGDVGSGKTVVALIALLKAVENGYQAALMAPTEILAEQHYRNFRDWLTPLGIHIAWLSGKLTNKQRQETIAFIRQGAVSIIVGTHALFQKDVDYANLALVVIDEQHRFGVHQRLALKEKGSVNGFDPHQLIMTATPIPRTLAMTAYADLDYSVIDELPPGRTPVTTVAIANTRRDEVLQRVRTACAEGSQAYWVCTLIDESDVLECQAAEATWEQLRQQLPDLRIGMVHGRLSPQDKEATMDEFKQGNLDLLVATTVIEVGVDVPNSSLMIIENPERLGLAQLHQLRGRVGRGGTKSYCVLLYKSPLSKNGKERLGIMRASENGFEISQKDLEIRGPGEVLGTRQTGLMTLRIADLIRDQDLLPNVKQASQFIIKEYPELIESLIARWIGMNEQYAAV